MSSSIKILSKERMSLVHDIVAREPPVPMPGKPIECFTTETGLIHNDSDIYIVTFPKTGTTLIQFICHLIRMLNNTTYDNIEEAIDKALDFDDIHQVCPHTSSAWFINQNLNCDQIAAPRLFKSHRQLQQLIPNSTATSLKYISTIRDPRTTLLSIYSFGKARQTDDHNSDLLSYAKSDKWCKEYNIGSITTIYDHYVTFWLCRNCINYLLLPYEDLIIDRTPWLPIIALYMNTPILSTDVIHTINTLTTKESMLNMVTKFDESWCKQYSIHINRPHPIIK